VVKHVGASVRESARDLIIEAEVANEDQQLKPGMFAEGRLLLPEEKVLTVPLTAVKTEGPTRRVFVVKDGQVVERLVEVGESRGDRVEIRQGVEAGDMVIVSPGPGAADGAKVKLTAQL
jgi:membrane fusion protein (multidrug efflux system)